MKIVLNPQFEYLKDFIYNLDDNFSKSGKVIYKGRNELRLFKQNDLQVNVKKYKIPNFFNRVVYTFFRTTKAQRAYQYALSLLDKEIETPVPIAYIEEKTYGLFSTGYFISLQSSYGHTLRELDQLRGNEDVLAEFAYFTAQLHKNNILHLDYSPGNILFDKTPEGYRFSLIDLNRMKFIPVDEDDGCRNFVRLCVSEETYRFIAGKYAEARGFDVESCQQKVLKYHKDHMKYSHYKDMVKKLGKFVSKSKHSIKYG